MSGPRPLVDCAAEFVTRSEKGVRHGVPFAEAEGVLFECPACNGGHIIMIFWKPRAAGTAEVGPEALWDHRGGDSLATLTLSPSIHVRLGCDAGFHGWVRAGQVTW